MFRRMQRRTRNLHAKVEGVGEVCNINLTPSSESRTFTLTDPRILQTSIASGASAWISQGFTVTMEHCRTYIRGRRGDLVTERPIVDDPKCHIFARIVIDGVDPLKPQHLMRCMLQQPAKGAMSNLKDGPLRPTPWKRLLGMFL